MATLVSNFFSALQVILKTLQVYDETLLDDEPTPGYWTETVPAIKEALLPLFNDFYNVIHKASLDPDFGLIHDSVDWLFQLIDTVFKGMPDTKDVLSQVSNSEIQAMMDAVETGMAHVPPQLPQDPAVFGKAASIVHRLILQKLSKRL